MKLLNGRGSRNRTHIQGFGDLSSTIKQYPYKISFIVNDITFKMAGVTGLEPITGGFEDRSSTIELHPYVTLFIINKDLIYT